MKENHIVSIVDFVISIVCIVLGICSIIVAILVNSDSNLFYTMAYIGMTIAFFILAYFAFKGAKENYEDYNLYIEALRFNYYNLKADIKDIFGEIHKSMDFADVKIETTKNEKFCIFLREL